MTERRDLWRGDNMMEGGDAAELESVPEVSLAGDTSVPSGFLDAEAWPDFPADTMLIVGESSRRRLGAF